VAVVGESCRDSEPGEIAFPLGHSLNGDGKPQPDQIARNRLTGRCSELAGKVKRRAPERLPKRGQVPALSRRTREQCSRLLDPQSLLSPERRTCSVSTVAEPTPDRSDELERRIFSLELIVLIVAKRARQKATSKVIARLDSADSSLNTSDRILQQRRCDGEDDPHIAVVGRMRDPIFLVRPEEKHRAGIDDNRPSLSLGDEDATTRKAELGHAVEHRRPTPGAGRPANDVEDADERAVDEQGRCLLLSHWETLKPKAVPHRLLDGGVDQSAAYE
jgi:hypothetical protein